MNVHKFVCPECKHEWSDQFGYEAEVMCPSCETVWRLKFGSYEVWPPTSYWIEGRSPEQPQFDLVLRGSRIPGCMKVRVERESFEAHSEVNFRMIAEFFSEYPNDEGDLSGPAELELRLRGHPEIRPIAMRVEVARGDASNTLAFSALGEFAYAQMEAMWEKTNP